MSDSVIAKLDNSVWKLFDDAGDSAVTQDQSAASKRDAKGGASGESGEEHASKSKRNKASERPEVD